MDKKVVHSRRTSALEYMQKIQLQLLAKFNRIRRCVIISDMLRARFNIKF